MRRTSALLGLCVGGFIGSGQYTLAADGVTTDLPASGNGRGSPFSVRCNPGEHLVGIEGHAGGWIDTFRIICASWNPDGRTWSGSDPASKTIGQSSGGGFTRALCPSGSTVNSIRIQETKGDGPTPVVHSISFTCHPVGSGGHVNKSFGSAQLPEGSNFPASVCPGITVAVGLHGRSGKFVDAVGVTCSDPPWPTASAQSSTDTPASDRAALERRRIMLERLRHEREAQQAQNQQSQNQQSQSQQSQSQQSPPAPAPVTDGAAPMFNGTWNTARSGSTGPFDVELVQNGRIVLGRYVSTNGEAGTIDGRFGANVMHFQWKQGVLAGTGQFNLLPDGSSFIGTYVITSDSPNIPANIRQGSWNGTRR